MRVSLCVRAYVVQCACFVSICGMGTSSLLCKHKRDIWCDRYSRSSFYFSAHSMLLLCYRAAAFVVSDFRGPRPMSMCIHLQAAPWRLKYWRIKAEVTISTFLYLQEFFTGAAILSERFRTLQICNVWDYIDDIIIRLL